jgi:hypothetical protein
MKSETERDRWHGMKALWRFGATAVLVSSAPLAVLANNSTPAAANILYDWQGTCTLGCTGIATGVLTLAAGNPYDFVRSNFISFEYVSSSGSFFLDNASPYLNAQGGISNPEGRFIFLEENAFGPNTLPLWQLVSYESAVLPITLSPEPGGWQFLNGSYFYQCLDPECRTWTDDVIRNVGVGGVFTPVAAVPVPIPIPGAGLPGLIFAGVGLLGWWRQRRKIA